MKQSLDETEKVAFMQLAIKESSLSSCVSRQVGCLLVPYHHSHHKVTIMGHNDLPAGIGRCSEEEVCRCFNPDKIAGQDLDKVYAIHAEASAIAYCAKHQIKTDNAILVVTDLPCNECAKLIIESGIRMVYYDREYPSSKAKWLFDKAGVEYEQVRVRA